MAMGEPLRGQKQGWNLIQKISEGDAGEIWLANSAGAKPITGIIKRPVHDLSGSEKQRQAGQITSEGRILGAIRGLNVKVAGATTKVVSLLDSSDLEGEISKNVFIVLERAAGLDLQFLQKCRGSSDFGDIDEEEREFLEKFSKLDRFPELLLTRMVAGLAAFLEKIHNHSIIIQDKTWSGVMWNDVKINHIFWDPFRAVFTVIDWGNAQLLGEGRVSADRRFSQDGDFLQYCDEMREFLAQASPELLTHLPFSGYHDNPAKTVRAVQHYAITRAEQSYKDLQRLRQEEKLLRPDTSLSSSISALQKYAEQIIAFGEAPDKIIWEQYMIHVRRDALLNLRLDDFKLASVAARSQKIPGWEFLNELFRLMGGALDPSDDGDKDTLKKILAAAEQENWIEVFWILRSLVRDPVPTWWPEVSWRLRECIIGAESSIKPPWEILKSTSSMFSVDDPDGMELRFIIENWKEMEPRDENGQNEQDLIEYKRKERIQKLLERSHPEDWRSFEKALKKPGMFADMTLDAWKGQNFENARGVLRRWLVYDPNRPRIFTINEQLNKAASWIAQAQNGPVSNSETISAFAAGMVRSSKLLIRVARGIPWLDERVKILKELEGGEKNIGRALQLPNAIKYFPWLKKYTIIWNDEDARLFYQALQSRLYEDADVVAATSSLNNWPVYATLAGWFKKLEENLYAKSYNLPDKIIKIIGTNFVSRIQDFPGDDSRARKALEFLDWMSGWQYILSKNGAASARQKLEEATIQFDEWALVSGIKTTLDLWRKLIDALMRIGPGNWDVSSKEELPQPLQNMILNLSKAVGAWNSFAQFPSRSWGSHFPELTKSISTATSYLQEWDKALPKEPLGKILVRKSADYIKLQERVAALVKVTLKIQARYQELSATSRRDAQKDQELLKNLTSLEKGLTNKNDYGPTWEREYPKNGCISFLLNLQDPVLTNEKHPLYPWYGTPRFSLGGACVIVSLIGLAVIVGFIFLPTLIPRVIPGVAEPKRTRFPTQAPFNMEIPASPIPAVEVPTFTPVPTLTRTLASPTLAVEVPSLTLAPTRTSTTVYPGDECEKFANWAATGDWSSYTQELDSAEKTYGELQRTCQWSYSYQQHVMDANLLKILSEWNKGDGRALSDLDNLHIQFFNTSPPYAGPDANLTPYDYVNWWRATLAICNLPQDLNTTQEGIIKSYLAAHLQKFPQAEDIFLRVCGWTDTTLAALNTGLDHASTFLPDGSSLLAMPGWPITIRKGCAFLGDGGYARWFLQPGQTRCPLPALVGMPNWEASYALTTKFCVVESPDNPSFTLWLHQPSADLGLRFDTKGNEITKLTNEVRLANSDGYQELGSATADSFPNTPGPLQVKCDTNYVEMFTVQPVWVGNLLFWRILDMDGDAAGEPVLLPLVAGVWPIADVNQPVDFYWDMNANSQTIYLLIRNLDLSLK